MRETFGPLATLIDQSHQIFKITSARAELDEASASELFASTKDEPGPAGDELPGVASNCPCYSSNEEADSDDIYDSDLDHEDDGESGTSGGESASSSYKDNNWQQITQNAHQLKAGRKKKGSVTSKFAAANSGIDLMKVNKSTVDNGKFPTHSHYPGLKSTMNSGSQTAYVDPPLLDEGGCLPNDLLLSSSNNENFQNTTNSAANEFLCRNTKWSLPPSMRDVLTTNKGASSGYLVSRMMDSSNLAGASSLDSSTSHYCHRSTGTQTLPDNEYPSHFYYTSPCFAAHLVEPAYIKCIAPEDLPSRKQIVQDSPPEGTLRLVIKNFSLMSDTVRGPSKMVQGVPWRIMIMPRQHIVQKKGTQKCLGFFLQCCPDTYSDSWTCSATAELRLISQKQGIQNFTRKTTHAYTSKENDWGYSCFMTWADILDENQGYILNDMVILEVHVKADRAVNILSLGEFRKKINEYIRVAQMQCDRGLIDKAIDCNSQAMKFCKDKDAECLRQLQAQNADLVARKLKQSIARIERGGDTATTEADPAANITALRIAMTGGNAARSANSNRSKRSKDSKNQEKRKDNDQTNEQLVNTDNNSLDNQSLKNETVNVSPVVSDKENDSLADANELDSADKCSANELHTYDCHCNKGLTYEQLASIDPNIIKAAALMEKGDLMKCLDEVANDQEAIQLMNDVLSVELFDESPEKMLPFRFELLARSLICHGGYTFADIVEKESNALFQLITHQKNVIENEDFSEDLYKNLFMDDLKGFTKFDPNDKQHQNLCKSIRKHLMSVNSECQTDFPSMTEVVGKKENKIEKPADKELDDLVRQVQSEMKEQQFESNFSLSEADRLMEALQQQQQQSTATSKRLMAPVEKKLKSNSSLPSQKTLLKSSVPENYSKRRGRPATPSGTPPDFRTEFKNGQFIRINKQIDAQGRIKAFQGVTTNKGGVKKCFEVFASGPSGKGCKAQAKMQFECEQRSYEYLEQHGYKMTPNNLNQFFNQMLKSFPDSGGAFDSYSGLMEQSRYRPQFDGESENSGNKTFENETSKFNALDEELNRQGLSSLQNFFNTNNFGEIHRRPRCSTYPPTATSRLQDMRSYNDEYRETVTRISLHLYELINRTVDTTYTLISYFQTQMNEIFQSPNVYEFPSLVNAVITFCIEYNLEKNLDELHVDEPGKLSLKVLEHQECTRHIFEGQGDKFLVQNYSMYFSSLQSLLSTSHIEIVPLIRKIMAFSIEQKRKNDDLIKEVESMRNEQKLWSKEKSQIQKMQKNEKTLNQRAETMKQECNQLKSQQKTWQKKESELNDELSKLRQTVESLNSKIQERDAQHSRDVQSLHDVKRNHSKELADRQAAMQKLKENLEERNAITKKLEQQCSQEKRNSQKMAERVKAAEISLVDNRMEQAIRVLERTRADSEPFIKQIDERVEIGGLTDDEIAILKRDLASLNKYKEDLNKLIEESRNEGLKHIEQIKEGKQLSQLPRAAFSKPIPLPSIQPIPPIRKPPQPTPIEIQQKVFLSPHQQSQLQQSQIQSSPLPSMSMPPPQTAPSAFRPLNNNAPPPSFSSQPPPTPNFMPNGSVQQQLMAQYMSQPQQQRPNIPIFTPNTPAPQMVPPTTPGPIGSRPLNFQTNANLVDQLRTNGLERPNLNAFTSSESTVNYNRSCTPAELEQIERMRNVRSLWEKDGNSSSTDSNNPTSIQMNPNPIVNPAAKFLQPVTPFSAEFVVPKPPTLNGQPGTTPNNADFTTPSTWGGDNIWSFNNV